jgi:hypothetical protein
MGKRQALLPRSRLKKKKYKGRQGNIVVSKLVPA